MNIASVRTDAQWGGLCARSESDRPHEWPALLWVIRYRTLSPRYPDTAADVVLQPNQFSYFNQWTGRAINADAIYVSASLGYAGDEQGWHGNDLDSAIQCARQIFDAPFWTAPFDRRFTTFWAPGGMENKNPAWAKNLVEILKLPGLERWRFGAER